MVARFVRDEEVAGSNPVAPTTQTYGSGPEGWVNSGEMVLIPENIVHGTCNPFDQDVTFLAILAPSDPPGPDIADVSPEETWAVMGKDRPPTR